MRILLSNDDGVFSTGMYALAKHLSKAHQVTVCAPDVQRSGAGHSFSSNSVRLRAEKVALDGLENVTAYSVNGTPADCTKLGMYLMGEYPDLVVSGINYGRNSATDVFYSGTVGAATEAAIYGVKAIAVSSLADEPQDYSACLYGLEKAMELMAENEMIKVLNVNAPDGRTEDCAGIKLTRLAAHIYPEGYEHMVDENGREYYRTVSGIVYTHKENEDCDDMWLSKGYITITPLRMNMTDDELLNNIKKGGFC